MPYTTAGKNIMLNALAVTHLSLHSADPGATGANELSGGSPAYARKTPSLAAASDGAREMSATVTFDVPAGSTVAYVGQWINSTFVGKNQITQETYGAQGTLEVDVTDSLADPA